jgi:hypothetical protein
MLPIRGRTSSTALAGLMARSSSQTSPRARTPRPSSGVSNHIGGHRRGTVSLLSDRIFSQRQGSWSSPDAARLLRPPQASPRGCRRSSEVATRKALRKDHHTSSCIHAHRRQAFRGELRKSGQSSLGRPHGCPAPIDREEARPNGHGRADTAYGFAVIAVPVEYPCGTVSARRRSRDESRGLFPPDTRLQFAGPRSSEGA